MRTLRSGDPPTVSPDGGRVAYVVVTPPEARAQSVRFLPNGTPVDAVGARIHVSGPGAVQAGGPPICDGRGNQWNPSWSPDGTRLGFYSDQGGRPELWIHELGDGTCRRTDAAVIRASLFAGYQPRWSPDGRTLYVPLRPDPPLEMSDAVDPMAFAAAGDGAGGEGDASAPPRIFRSGSEATDDERAAGSVDLGAFAMANYNAGLAAVDAGTGEVRMLVDARTEPRPTTLKVSPSGRWLGYASVPAGNPSAPLRSLVLVPTAGGDPSVLVEGLASTGNGIELDYRWHPADDRLVYLHENAVWDVDFGAGAPGTPRRLAQAAGEPVAPVLYFTRDGRSLVVGVDPQGTGRERAPGALAVVPLDGGAPVRLPLPDPAQWQFLGLVRANEDVLWQPDPGHLTVQLRDRVTGHEALYRIALDSGQARRLDAGLHRLRHFGSGGDHRRLHAVYEDIATPPDLYRYDADLKRGRRASTIEPRLDGVAPARAEVVETVVPLHDGRLQTVRTTLLLPQGAKAGDRLPAIVMIYSGSDLSTSATQYGGGMGNTVPNQVFTSRGFAVVMADIRLSEMGEPAHPAQDITDALLPQVYALANAGYVDIGRLAVSGQSYGGYSTAAVVSTTHLFRAAIPVNGTFDLAGFYGGMDGRGSSFMTHWAEKGQGRMGEPPWENVQRYIANSPYYRIDRIRTPLLIVAGENDNAVPFEESKRLFVGLRRLERPAQLAIYPGEGHVVSDWSVAHAADASRRMVDFLRRHLAPR
ncbi:prolyl oligopeptidase family serine peptidase [Luteimonas sp. Y-2-2-4F]|nr:prolyl oligopeptidase family serine peptidase [Luteimonas sp. Y-2-2-4F]MCD9032120.1 prolyl oligopeptidase family serine peptidase [Luteimonas sp. Y-2-2-4F]